MKKDFLILAIFLILFFIFIVWSFDLKNFLSDQELEQSFGSVIKKVFKEIKDLFQEFKNSFKDEQEVINQDLEITLNTINIVYEK